MQGEDQRMLQVRLRSTDQSGWTTAAQALMARAAAMGLSGGTTLCGLIGVDRRGWMTSRNWWSIRDDRPVLLEIIDAPPAIERFLSELFKVAPQAEATVQRVRAFHVQSTAQSGQAAASGLAIADLPTTEAQTDVNFGIEGRLLRVFIDESDQWEGRPLYLAIVQKAQELGLSGASVFRGGMGFGSHSRLHADRLVDASDDLPIVVEVVDVPEKIEALAPFLEQAVAEGLVTLESVRMIRFSKT